MVQTVRLAIASAMASAEPTVMTLLAATTEAGFAAAALPLVARGEPMCMDSQRVGAAAGYSRPATP